MGYFARERIFRGCGPNLTNWTVVFAVDDLTDVECRTLESSVQRCLTELHDQCSDGPWGFELGASAADDPAGFVILKSEWEARSPEIQRGRNSSSNSSQYETYWLHSIAAEHADIIRGMRDAHFPTVYLQCDAGSGYQTFEVVDSLTWDELETLEEVLHEDLYRMGMILRIISDWHAEREPATYVQARVSWKEFEEDNRNGKADDTRLAALGSALTFIEEIKALRGMPVIFGPAEEGHVAGESKMEPRAERANGEALATEPLAADESLRAKYRDPDNYWRNVWLYEQRKEGKTNTAILDELSTNAATFAPLESDNALRKAIESIASYHRWPVIRGRTGRPKAKNSDGD